MTEINKACCSLPPVKSAYKPVGTTTTIAGLECYVTGPQTADKALIAVYDIFGMNFSQVKQGADLLGTQGYKVVIPDFFRGQPFPDDTFPAFDSPMKSLATMTAETKSALMAFMGSSANFATRQPDLLAVVEHLRNTESIANIGAYGLCWGGKLVILTASQNPTAFSAIAQVHPARMEPEDAEGLTIPLASYISDDESVDAQKQLEEIMSRKKFDNKLNDFKHFVGMHHGFAGSRADLSNEVGAENFQDVYNRLASFFARAL
ncbi:dienelactone hydrolase [Fimicolochytrium jonesii]|uniref:dienelactone hydrolase n=1 Tax=Fimicolochytrium jonesii TaxID=1396493 RepID=UPI0022FF092B|nr:dienelactone hydrolase [Fimicolochytrium jonesii]KAI8818509.1 dienelactone hydrolase [Fimicolochytrium jonesii]